MEVSTFLVITQVSSGFNIMTFMVISRAGASYFRLVRLCGVNKLGGLGACSPRKVFKISHSEMASEAMFGPKCY